MTKKHRSAPTLTDALDRTALDFIANAPEAEFEAFLEEEGNSVEDLSARGAGAIDRALKVHGALRQHSRLQALASQDLPESHQGLLELATMLHQAAASTGLIVSLQQVELDSLSDEQLRSLIVRLQEICAEAASNADSRP